MTPNDPRHGQNAGYIAGCRGECCREAHAAYRRKLRARRYLARVEHFKIPALGTTRRIRALQALGWRYCDIDRAMGYELPDDLNSNTVSHNIVHQVTVHRDTAAKVAEVYDRLSMRLGPSQRVRDHARKHGYLPPLAWDDIDDETERPTLGTDHRRRRDDVDEAVVMRVMAGEQMPTTRAEKDEIVRRMRRAGWSLLEIETRTGITKAERYGREAAA